jgi:hypothetical protein
MGFAVSYIFTTNIFWVLVLLKKILNKIRKMKAIIRQMKMVK